ncbi:MAG TPA: NAD(P)/FAD-dependent oxidoreductase [Vicinamibacterales bacterium]
MTDVIFVGGGHNGLTAAAVLARRGVKTLVLEARATVGGAAITEELHPGFKVSTLAHAAQPAAPVIAELRLADHGLELIDPDPYLVAPLPDGRSLMLGRDVDATANSIATFSAEDARRYPEFCATLARVRAFAADVMAHTPPNIEQPSNADLWKMVRTGRRFRGLGKRDAYRLLRWAPMSAADFVSEWFESEPLRAVIAAGGIFGTALGPRSAGSAAVLLMRMGAGDGRQRLVRGGLGALTSALASAARSAGADIRTNAEVGRIHVKDGRATGVSLTSGEELQAKAVVSNADPRRTLLGLIDPVELEPGFLARIRSYRAAGTVAKINLALSALPTFTALRGDTRALGGFIHIGPELDYLERAFDASKYGTWSAHPYLEVTIPSLSDPALAPAGAHVMSITAQYAPYRLRSTSWEDASAAFADAAIDTLAQYAPDLQSLILHRQVITPVDLEAQYGLTGGHIFHGELALDQLFMMRPLLGWAQYRTPIQGLYLCGAGTHPGYGVSGLSGLNAAREILKDL